MTEIEKALQAFITDELYAGGEIDWTESLMEQEVIDSLGIFSLISFLEERFSVVIPPEEVNLDNFDSLASISKLVEAKLA